MHFEGPRTSGSSLAGVLLGVWFALPAAAGVTPYTDPDVGGFVPDTATAAFCTAIGGTPAQAGCEGSPREFTSFEVDIDGEPLPPDSLVPGGELARFAALSSLDAGDPDLVLATTGEPGTSRVGPEPGFVGRLEIEFLADGASAVGLGPVALGTNATIRFFDPEGAELLATPGASNAGFTFVGVTTSEGDLVRRVVIEGAGPYALQDLQYVIVPEPGAGLLGAAALAIVGLCRRRAAH